MSGTSYTPKQLEKMREIKRQELEEQKAALEKMDNWKKAGAALFDSEEMKEKWNRWVERMATDPWQRGMMVEETLQVLKMFKANAPLEEIATVIEQMSGGLSVIDDFVPAFVGAELPYEVRQIIDERSKSRGSI